jgi:signal transduction histidine kinase/CheY-like chemotaxis protein
MSTRFEVGTMDLPPEEDPSPATAPLHGETGTTGGLLSRLGLTTGGPLTRLGLLRESHEERREQVLLGVLATTFRQVPQSVLGSIVAGVALMAAFWKAHDVTEEHEKLVIWFIALLFESLLRLRAAGTFLQATSPGRDAGQWARRWVQLAALSGAVWGVAGFLFFFAPSHIHEQATLTPQIQQLVLGAVILGVVFSSLTLYAAHGPALNAFLPLALLPLLARLLAEQQLTYYIAAAFLASLLAYTLFFGRSFGRTIADSVKNNIENELLVNQLQAEKRVVEDARRAAEAATRSKTRFFAAASHDLRQPLQAIGIYCSLLRKRAQGPLVPMVRNLATGVESLSRLVEELLEISRLDSGVIHPQVSAVSLSELFAVLQQEFEPLAGAKRLELRVRPTNLHVSSDPHLLARVLRNFIGNAVRYTHRGGVLVGARRRGANVSIDVVDTGPGIHRQELDRIFEEFYRGQSSKEESGVAPAGGFGLGLSIVRRICGVLGHPLIVRTRPGSGTVFRIEVPRSAVAARPSRNGNEAGDESPVPLTGLRFVVLEDNEAILVSLSRLLRSWGADVVSSTGFTGALVKHLGMDRRIDLVIVDQNLGGPIDGAEAAFRIRELVGIPVPIIMLTAMTALDTLAEFQRQMKLRLSHNPEGAAAIARSRVEEPIILTKPTSAGVLHSRVVTALGLKRPASDPSAAPIPEGKEERIL